MVKSADASFSYLLHFADVLKSNTKLLDEKSRFYEGK